jgi:hypothetical protein
MGVYSGAADLGPGLGPQASERLDARKGAQRKTEVWRVARCSEKEGTRYSSPKNCFNVWHFSLDGLITSQKYILKFP